jgi:4-amino-4-deoxy-L-arabinose transferase-like glycosyltransferase
MRIEGFHLRTSTAMAKTGLTVKRFRTAWPHASLDLWDLLSLGIMLLLWFSLVVLNYDAIPLQLWDEGRIANYALEMVQSGNWLVPTYAGAPDHVSVKPPLLVWQMASLMWLGLPPLLAVRMPTMLAALGTLGTMWAICRYGLHDRVAGVISGVLLISSRYYTDYHVARTGDYDVLLSFLTLLYAMTFWLSLGQDGSLRTKWFVFSTITFFLAVMTKGTAGIFGLAGLFVFSLVTGRLYTLLADYRVWLWALLALLLCTAYYGSRELYDAGFLQAAWYTEIGGRFFEVSDGHEGGRRFYINLLLWRFEPGVILLPFATLTVLRGDPSRRSMVMLCLLCAATTLVVLTISRTKIYWYATPILPFLAIAGALGVADGLRWIKEQEPHIPRLFRTSALQVMLGILLAVASAVSIYRNQFRMPAEQAVDPYYAQGWYGTLFGELKASGISSAIVLDGGDPECDDAFTPVNSSFFCPYNPMLKFYADIARTKGLEVEIIPLNQTIPVGKLVATCDPKLIPRLRHRDGFSLVGQVRSCIFGTDYF